MWEENTRRGDACPVQQVSRTTGRCPRDEDIRIKAVKT